MNNHENYISTYDKVFSTIIVLLPFLYQYKGLGNIISFGELLLFPLIIIYILLLPKKKIKIQITSELTFYFIIISLSFLTSLYNYFSFSNFATVFARIIFYLIVFQIAKNHFKINYIFKFYSKVVLVFSCYLILQYLIYKFTGNYLPRYISDNLLFPPEKNVRILSDYYKWNFRPSSLFLEPGYFTLFCIPYISILAFQKKKKLLVKIEYFLVLVALFLSGSSAAIVSILIIAFLFFSNFLKEHGIGKGVNLIITLIAAFFALIVIVNNFSDNDAISRTMNGASLNYRVTRGIIIYKDMPIVHKLIGVGINNLGNYMKYNNISTQFDELNLDYCSSFLQILTNTGLIGFIFFIFYLLEIWKVSKKNIYSRFLFVLLLFILSYENVLFSYRFCFIYVFLCGLNKFQYMQTEQ